MVKDIVPASFDFIEKHILDIILVVLLLFGVAIYVVLNNIKFPKSHPKLQRVVVLENLENIDPEDKDSDHISDIESGVEEKADKKIEVSQPKTTTQNTNLCSGSLQDKNKYCTTLATKNSCGNINCCVWAKKNEGTDFSCMGGDEGGATYDGHDYDEYYYKIKRFPESDVKKTSTN